MEFIGFAVLHHPDIVMRIHDLHAFIGTYTEGTQSGGIYSLYFDANGNAAAEAVCVASQKNPATLLINESDHILYATEESFGASGEEGGVWSYRILDDGNRLDPLDRVGSGGVGPCCLSWNQSGRTLFTANLHSGSLTSIRLRRDGALGKVSSHVQLSGSSAHVERQKSSHPHAILMLPGTSYVLVTDLGADTLSIFELDRSKGTISSRPCAVQTLPAGSGPRHVTLHPDRPFAYVIHEIASAITMHRLGGPEYISPALQTISLTTPGFSGIANAADIIFDQAHGRIYASVRRTNSLHCFSADPETGFLRPQQTFPSGGASPHALALDRTGELLFSANSLSGNIATLRMRTSAPPSVTSIPSPAAIALL